MYGCGKDCMILTPFKLLQISCFTLRCKCFSSNSDSFPDVGIRLLLQFRHPSRAGPVLLTLLFFPQFLHPTEFCMDLYILFHWSGPPVHSQLIFCMHFCVWRCIPDVSVERDVLPCPPTPPPSFSKTADVDCSHKLKRCLLLGRKLSQT